MIRADQTLVPAFQNNIHCINHPLFVFLEGTGNGQIIGGVIADKFHIIGSDVLEYLFHFFESFKRGLIIQIRALAGERIEKMFLPYRQAAARMVVTYMRMDVCLKKSFRTHCYDRCFNYSCRLMGKNDHERYLSVGHNFIVGIIEAFRLGKFC